MSDGPPGGHGTMIVTVFVGQLCAAAAEHNTRHSTPIQHLILLNIVISVSPQVTIDSIDEQAGRDASIQPLTTSLDECRC
jgi:hypothetical protein